jgi:hypothetical protein
LLLLFPLLLLHQLLLSQPPHLWQKRRSHIHQQKDQATLCYWANHFVCCFCVDHHQLMLLLLGYLLPECCQQLYRPSQLLLMLPF